MIFPKDVASAVNWMEARWGNAGSAWESWQEFAVDFEPYDLKEFRRVLEEAFVGGEKFPPKPGQVIARLRGSGQVVEYSPESCKHPEPWGFDVLENHDREVFCRLCGYSWVVPPSGVLTEREAGSRW